MWFRSQDRLVPARLWWAVCKPPTVFFLFSQRVHIAQAVVHPLAA